MLVAPSRPSPPDTSSSLVRGGLALLVLGLVACGGGRSAEHPAAEAAPARSSGVGPRHGHHHRFDDAESWAKVFDDPARDAWQKPDQVVAALAISKGMVVADIGAGTGYFEPHLARAVGPEGTVLAVDVEPDMVRWLEDRARRENLSNVRASLAKPDDPRLAPGSVDRVVIVDTWHHLDDRVAYARRLGAALRPGGRIAIVDYTKTAPEGPPLRMRLAPEQVVAELEQAGLRAVVVDAGLPRQYVVVGSRRADGVPPPAR